MATQVQFRRGTTTQNNAFTGAIGEITYDSEAKTLRLHDGSTAGGGSVVATLAGSQTLTNKTLSTNSVWQGTVVGLAYGGTAANLTAVAGGVVYSGGSALAISAAGTSGQVLTSAGSSAPTWTSQSSLTVGTATTSTTTSNINGGSAGNLVYQVDTNDTGFIAPGETGYLLRSTGASTAPDWVAANLTIGSTAVALGTTVTSFAGLNTLASTGTSHWTLPVGNTSQRPESAVAGMVRYNSQISSFEGYGPGNAWGSLGGVKDVDGDTYILTEVSAGSDEDTFTFYNAGSITATLSGTKLDVKSAVQVEVNNTTDSSSITTGALVVDGGVGIAKKLYVGTDANVAGTLAVTGNQTNTGDLAVNGGDITTSATTFNLLNTTATTLNIGGAATTVSIGAATGTLTLNNANTVITGDLTVNGTTTTINATTITVDDKNIELGSVASPSNTTADGGGITLKGATDKTLNWINSTGAWTSSEDFNVVTGKTYEIAAIPVLTSNSVLNDSSQTSITVGGSATTLTIGATSGTATIRNSTVAITNAATVGSTLGVTGVTTLTGALNANGGIAVDTNAFTVADTTGNTAIAGTLNVTGATVLNGGLTMDTDKFTVADTTGNTGIGGTLAVTGVTTLTGALAANGGITVDTNAFTVADTTGNTAIAGTLNVTGATVLNGGLTMDSTAFTVADTTGNTAIAGTLNVTGTTTLGNLTIGSSKTVSMGSNIITNVASPSAGTDAANKQYVDEVAQGLKAAPAVEVATTANLTATYSNGTAGVGATLTATSNGAFPAIDGITVDSTAVGLNGVLVKNQSTAAQNGRYNLTQVGNGSTPWILTRCGVCDQASEIPGSYVFVKGGTTQANTGWVAYVADPDTFVVGTNSITYFQFSGVGTFTAGTGLTLTGTQFSVNASQTQVTAVGTLTSGTWNASVIAGQYGGTGVANTGKTITIGGNFTTSGAHTTTLTTSGNTSVTLPTTGTLATLDGTETFTNKTLTSPTLTTPVLGTPSSGTLTSCTGLPVATGISGLGTGVATFLATPSSANLISAITDETGSGSLVFGTSPAITTSLTTPSTTFALVNTNATTVNFAGAATTVSIGAGTGTTTVNNSLTITGDLVVNGTTTTVNSTNVTIDNNIFGLGGDTAPSVDDAKDRGISFRWHNGSAAKQGFFGWDRSTSRFSFVPDASFSSDVVSGTQGDIDVNNIFINGTAATGTGGVVRATSPTLVTPALGTPSSATLTNATGLPISTGVSGLGTGVATALAVNTGSAGAVVLFNGALGTPSSATLTNATGLPVSGITASTSTAIGVGSIELGHATDTTIARVSAGVISVEGVTVPTISSTNTLTNKTISGSSNTLSNIANASLTNSAVTIGSTSVSLGATVTTFAGLSSVTSTTFVGALTGNASTATTLATARTIGGVSFNGSANIDLPGVNTAGNQNTTGSAATLTTARTIGGVSFNGSANINLPGVNTAGNQNTTGSAATLTTPRAIQGVNFDGSAAITVLTAGTGVSVSGTQVSIGQAVATSSNVQFNSLGVGTAGSATAGEIRATNAITSFYSDERLKENITEIDNAIEKVMSLRGVTYTSNQLAETFGYTNKEEQVGVIAQDVEKVLPQIVKPAPFDIISLQEGIEISRSGENYKTVQYEKLVPLLIQAIKEQQVMIEELQKKVGN